MTLETYKITPYSKDAGLCPKCENCERRAYWLVMVPWVHIATGEIGADWMPFCRRCKPDESSWEIQKVDDDS